MSEITSIVYDDKIPSRVLSFIEDGKPVKIQYSVLDGRVLAVTTGTMGAGEVLVIEYNNSREVTATRTVSYSPGLTVVGAQLVQDGKIYRGIGVNFFDLLDHPDYAAQLAILAANKIPFIRINFGQFAAGASQNSEWRKYLSNKASWYALRDSVVSTCESLGIGLVISMFWRIQTIPDLMKYLYPETNMRDSVSEWGIKESRTRKFMREHTEEVVNRYKNSPAIWGWEFANEVSNLVDAYPSGTISAQMTPASGGPPAYLVAKDPQAIGETDVITQATMNSAIAEWADVIKTNDSSGRLRTDGNAVSVPNRYNQLATLFGYPPTFAKQDDYAQWMGRSPVANGTLLNKPIPVLQRFEGTNVLCTHMYSEARQTGAFFSDQSVGETGLLSLIAEIAAKEGVPLFVGEFGNAVGYAFDAVDRGQEVTFFNEFLKSLIQNKVSLSAIWNYGYLPNNSVKDFNIDIGTGREYQLYAVAFANQQLLP